MRPSDSSDKIQQLHNTVRRLLQQKLNNEQIIDALKDQKLEPYYIEIIIGNIRNETVNKKSFRNCMIMGACYIIGGLGINYFSYIASENTNSNTFLLFWGIVVFGIVTIVRGFILYRK